MTVAQLFLHEEEIEVMSIIKSGSSGVMGNDDLPNDSLSTFLNGGLGTPEYIVDLDDRSFNHHLILQRRDTC